MGTVEQLVEQLRQPNVIAPSEAAVRLWCEQKAAEAWRDWETSGKKLLAEKEPWFNGTAVSFTLAWQNGVIQNGAAKVEVIGKTITVASEQELIGGAAYGT
jgi:hypothetical protein